MLKKRLVGVITVKDGWAVQSFGYGRYLPLGHPEYLAETLDRWGADEILILCIDRSRRGLGPDLGLIRRVGSLGLSTPLSYGGGIRTVEEAGEIIHSGAERICIDAVMRNAGVVRRIATLVGAQAIIGTLPLSLQGTELELYDYLSGRSAPLTLEDTALFEDRVVSEALIVDWHSEGSPDAFEFEIVQRFPVLNVPLIVFGGISESAQIERLLAEDQVVAVGVGNFLSYREHAIQVLKRETVGSCIRGARFASDSR